MSNLLRRIGWLFLGLSFVIESVGAEEVVRGSSPPNIVFILIDDQRWDTVGYAGNSVIQTPIFDQRAPSVAS